MQGWRISMEDAHTHILTLSEDKDAAFFAGKFTENYYFCRDSLKLENKIFLFSLWWPWRLQNCITRFKTFAQIHCSTTRVQRGKIRKGNCERLFRMWRGHENWWKLKRWNVWIYCYNSFAQVSNIDILIQNLRNNHTYVPTYIFNFYDGIMKILCYFHDNVTFALTIRPNAFYWFSISQN